MTYHKSLYKIPKMSREYRSKCSPNGVWDGDAYRVFTEYEGLAFRAKTLADFMYGDEKPVSNRCRFLPLCEAPRFTAHMATCSTNQGRGFARDVPSRCQ